MRNRLSGFSIHKVFRPVIAQFDNAAVIEAPRHRATPISILYNLIWIRNHVKGNGVIHMTGGPHYFLLALKGKRNILTIHDLVLLHNSTGLKHAIYKQLWFQLPIRYAKAVTCISETVAKDLSTNFTMPKEKIHIIYNAVDTNFRYTEKAFNSNNPRILHVGTTWNKNLERVIKALIGVPCTLVIIGAIDKHIQTILETNNIIYIQKQNISDAMLRKEYELADIVSFPSIYEGFGMPIVEGQAVGRPVLTSNIAAMTEIANGGACLVDPTDETSIKNGFLKIIQDETFRQQLIRAGKENIKRFSVEKITKQYKDLYTSLL